MYKNKIHFIFINNIFATTCCVSKKTDKIVLENIYTKEYKTKINVNDLKKKYENLINLIIQKSTDKSKKYINDKLLLEEKNKIIDAILESNLGFDNPKNTCFLNSSIQFLCSNKSFLDKFINTYFLSNYDEKNIISNNLFKILYYKYLLINTNAKFLNLTDFRNSIYETIKDISDNTEEDVEYFITELIKKINSELFTYQNKIELNVVTLKISRNNESINNLLRKKKNIETSDFLIIKIERVKEENNVISKINDNVTLDEEITIKNTKYALKSIVAHIGNKASEGHYVTYAKHNNTWVCYDDKKCYECKYKNDINKIRYKKLFTNKNIKQCVYLLLYEKINTLKM